jgi:hypothetical protein
MKFMTRFDFFAFHDCAFAALFPLLLQTRVMMCGSIALETVDISFLFEAQIAILMARTRRNRKKSMN